MLDLVVSVDFRGANDLREQLKSTVVVGQCDCGCPSVDLQVGTDAPAARLDSRLLPCELEIVPASDEPPGQVILFADDGRLSYLEYVFYGRTPTEMARSEQGRGGRAAPPPLNPSRLRRGL
jgi:hypothetical protein